jgi:hypothetical protein
VTHIFLNCTQTGHANWPLNLKVKTGESKGDRIISNYFSNPEGKRVPVHAMNVYEGVEI